MCLICRIKIANVIIYFCAGKVEITKIQKQILQLNTTLRIILSLIYDAQTHH